MNEKRTDRERVRKFIDLTVEDRTVHMLFRASAADISPGGMRVVTNQYLARGSSYTFTLKRAPHLTLRGEVRWIEQMSPDSFRAGVRFVQNPPHVNDTLHQFVTAELAHKASPPL